MFASVFNIDEPDQPIQRSSIILDNINMTNTSNNDTSQKPLTAAEQIPKTHVPAQDELIEIMVTRFEKLVERGFLAPHFLQKMVSDPEEVLKFLRQNRAVVYDQLNRRLHPHVRPTPEQLESKGIVPRGYFKFGHKAALNHRHRRVSSAHQDLEGLIKLRSKPEKLVSKGIVQKQEMQERYPLDESFLEQQFSDDGNIKVDNEKQADAENKHIITVTAPEEENTRAWEISILSSLLFLTIQDALRKSCLDTQRQEHDVLNEMETMNNEMKALRDTLDQYFLSAQPVIDFERDEQMVRDKFHQIQQKLLQISNQQTRIHDKLRILHNVERAMIDLQNNYDQNMNNLLKKETLALSELQRQREMRDRAKRIMYAERSHQNWAMAKLDFTIHVGKDHNSKISQQLKSGKTSITSENELNDDQTFVSDLEQFLLTLRQVSQHQHQIVLDYDTVIDNLDSNITAIRHEKSNVRRMVFRKIYELHKQVQIAETLELGNRRLSVGSATEIDRERRHHYTKIQRQIDTLHTEVMTFNYEFHHQQLREILDVEVIMSDSKMKAFFSVFVQTFCQIVIDVELTWRNLNCTLPPHPSSNEICGKLYGIQAIQRIQNSKSVELYSKLSNITRFVHTIKFAILYEQRQQERRRQKRDRLIRHTVPRPNLTQNNAQYQGKPTDSNNNNNSNNANAVDDSKGNIGAIREQHDKLQQEALDKKKQEEEEEMKELLNNNDALMDSFNEETAIAVATLISTHRLINVAVMIARKLCVSEIMVDDIDRCVDQQVPRLAEMSAKDVFEAVINQQKIFKTRPLSILDVATSILRNVFGILRTAQEYNQYY